MTTSYRIFAFWYYHPMASLHKPNLQNPCFYYLGPYSFGWSLSASVYPRSPAVRQIMEVHQYWRFLEMLVIYRNKYVALLIRRRYLLKVSVDASSHRRDLRSKQ